MPEKIEDQYSAEETDRRRDAVIKRMLSTPPKPHSEMSIGKSSVIKRPIPKKMK